MNHLHLVAAVVVVAEVVATPALAASHGFTRPVPSLVTAVGHGVVAGREAFFHKLPLTPDAREPWDAAAHLRPIFLTGLPQREHMENPGDMLVDDLPKYEAPREEAGGAFVHHRDARSTLEALGLDVRR